MEPMIVPKGYSEYKKKKLQQMKEIEKYLKETEYKTRFYIV